MARSLDRRATVMLALVLAWPSLCVHSAFASEPASVTFTTDVRPVLTKLGCNGGGCHGKATGQNGFKLSLLGYEPADDYESIVLEGRGRRLFPAYPPKSLLLLKATGTVPHGGGRILDVNSEDYAVLSRWIAQGAPPPKSSDPVVERIAIEPKDALMTPKARLPLKITASFSDGSTRDVTRLALYESNEPSVAEVGNAGMIETQARGGLFAVMVRYGDNFGVFHGTVPFHTPKPAALTQTDEDPKRSWVDRLLRQQWNWLGIEPSPPADDATFLRRASLDICGTVPTPEETRAYLADRRPDKRARLIDRLLERPEYASYFGLKWADILKNRGAGYSTSRQRPGTTLFASWIRDAIATNMPFDRFATEILTATGSQEVNPPTVWYRSVRTSQDYVESVSQAFLGVRVQCAQCHHHPAERWSQDDYYGLAAVFARIGRKGGFADAEVPTSQTIFLAPTGKVEHPRTKKVMRPRALGGPTLDSGRDDPRKKFAAWMTDPSNPFFARTMANRIWGHFFGRGLIHPIDDSRSTNPPSHPELLDALASDFAKSGYDVKHLIRVCCNSEAYALSAQPNASNREDHQSFARYYPRRLHAEVLLDAISQTLAVPTEFPGGPGKFPLGTRAIDLPDEAVPNEFLDVFGRPARTSACECERVGEPSLGQALALIGSPIIEQKLSAKNGYVAELAADKRPLEAVVKDLFVRVFARPARPDEVEKACRFIESQPDRRAAYQSLLWSLLVTAEFLFNH